MTINFYDLVVSILFLYILVHYRNKQLIHFDSFLQYLFMFSYLTLRSTMMFWKTFPFMMWAPVVTALQIHFVLISSNSIAYCWKTGSPTRETSASFGREMLTSMSLEKVWKWYINNTCIYLLVNFCMLIFSRGWAGLGTGIFIALLLEKRTCEAIEDLRFCLYWLLCRNTGS